jgi:hypothetical protein
VQRCRHVHGTHRGPGLRGAAAAEDAPAVAICDLRSSSRGAQRCHQHRDHTVPARQLRLPPYLQSTRASAPIMHSCAVQWHTLYALPMQPLPPGLPARHALLALPVPPAPPTVKMGPCCPLSIIMVHSLLNTCRVAL